MSTHSLEKGARGAAKVQGAKSLGLARQAQLEACVGGLS